MVFALDADDMLFALATDETLFALGAMIPLLALIEVLIDVDSVVSVFFVTAAELVVMIEVFCAEIVIELFFRVVGVIVFAVAVVVLVWTEDEARTEVISRLKKKRIADRDRRRILISSVTSVWYARMDVYELEIS